MKTINFLIVTGLLLSAGFTKSIAGENEIMNQAFTELNAQLNESLKNIPFEDVNNNSDNNLITVTFTVNDNHEIGNIEVTGTDEYIVNCAKRELEKKSFKVNPYFDGKTCRVPIRVIDGTR